MTILITTIKKQFFLPLNLQKLLEIIILLLQNKDNLIMQFKSKNQSFFRLLLENTKMEKENHKLHEKIEELKKKMETMKKNYQQEINDLRFDKQTNL